MTRIYLSLLLFFGLLSCHAQESIPIELRVSKLKSNEGSIMIAFYTADIPFLGDQVSFSHIAKVNSSEVQNVSLTIPKGKYAIGIYQDLNEDKELNTGFFGIPKEPYGFSNDAMGLVGPPSFEEAMIVVDTPDQVFKMTLK